MDGNFDTLNGQLSAYGTRVESEPQWLKESRYVEAYHIIQERVDLGLSIFDNLTRRGLREDITVYEARTICELYEKWMEESRHWVACASASARRDHKVSGADALNEKIWIIHSWLPQLHSLAGELTSVIDGHGIPFEDSLNAA